MTKDQAAILSFRCFFLVIVLLSAFSFSSILYWFQCSAQSYSKSQMILQKQNQPINLLSFPSKWRDRSHARGLKQHALALHLALAKKGHELHVFTTSPLNSAFPSYPISNLYFHFQNQRLLLYQTQNLTGKPFDVVHIESAGLWYAQLWNMTNLAVTWHGIAYETIHTDIIEELLRNPEELKAYGVKFLRDYAHHVATGDHAGDEVSEPDDAKDKEFKQKFGVTKGRLFVLGMAGSTFRANTIVLVAGDSPWGPRYRDLGANALVLGPMEQTIFVNPTVGAHGLDHTLLEAMLSGLPVMATRVACITGAAIIGKEMGFIFSTTVLSLKNALYRVLSGIGVLEKKGQVARQRGSQHFTATKMAAAYERLFLCISNDENRMEDYCQCQPSVQLKNSSIIN
ncbi:hypothetical protein P3X46_015659 [Hevea brasiliensis]|uniref:Glycosyltransferase subfamily 4-like N-terminal domain-containing protein n=1 Tax=Hevea brasiliensis TaxID=3981 RepID=A0ABQ9M0N2_HEVBR|nr:hypothetical protein P3X46_015659 [Hevea brasiliensis]